MKVIELHEKTELFHENEKQMLFLLLFFFPSVNLKFKYPTTLGIEINNALIMLMREH